MSEKVFVKGESGKKYEVITHAHGNNNVEIVLVYAGIVMSCTVRPLKGRGCTEGFIDLIKKADLAADKIHIETKG